jgi:CheY-like chemotaxis protein
MSKGEQRQPIVLIAEDDSGHLLLLRRAFKQFGYAGPTQYVSDGQETVAYLAGEGKFQRRSEFPLPDFVLLDLKMPRMSGLEVLAWIRTQPTLAQLRTVVLTTSDDLRDIRRAYQLGASSFLTKPVVFTEFKDTVQALFNYWLTLNKTAPSFRPAPGRRPSN